MYKLYEEIPSARQGMKKAKPNKREHVGLSQTLLGPCGFLKVLLSCNIPPPSMSGMQKSANEFIDKIEDMNQADIHRRRQDLKHVLDIHENQRTKLSLMLVLVKHPFNLPLSVCIYKQIMQHRRNISYQLQQRQIYAMLRRNSKVGNITVPVRETSRCTLQLVISVRVQLNVYWN